MASTDASRGPSRPLSPHLAVYRLSLSMIMSGLHRITGMALYAGTLLLAWYLVAVSMDAGAFVAPAAFLNSIIGRLILFGFTWSLFHHMLGGVRHALWNSGYGLDAPVREWLAWGTLIGAGALTILVWAIALLIR